VVGAHVLLAACASPTEPEPVEVAAPLSSITLDVRRGSPFPWLEIKAEIAGGSRPLKAHERVGVSVTTSAGDHEDLLLAPEICERSNYGPYLCRWLDVYMKAGRDVRTLRQPVEHLGAWLLPMVICDGLSGECPEPGPRLRRLGMVYVPGDQDIHRVRDALAWVPGVQWVDLSGIFHTTGLGGTPVAGESVYARVPLVTGPGLQGDGIAQVTDGDLVLVTTADGGVQASLSVSTGGAGS
jgi:hypothetical protein